MAQTKRKPHSLDKIIELNERHISKTMRGELDDYLKKHNTQEFADDLETGPFKDVNGRKWDNGTTELFSDAYFKTAAQSSKEIDALGKEKSEDKIQQAKTKVLSMYAGLAGNVSEHSKVAFEEIEHKAKELKWSDAEKQQRIYQVAQQVLGLTDQEIAELRDIMDTRDPVTLKRRLYQFSHQRLPGAHTRARRSWRLNDILAGHPRGTEVAKAYIAKSMEKSFGEMPDLKQYDDMGVGEILQMYREKQFEKSPRATRARGLEKVEYEKAA